MNRLIVVGVGLMLGGAAVAEVSYYMLGNVTSTIMGLVCMIVGAAIFQIPTFATKKRRIRAVVEGGYSGAEKLLREKKIGSRAVYLPPNEGVSLVYVAVDEGSEVVDSLKGAVEEDLKGRGLVFPAPGSPALKEASKGEEKDVSELLRLVIVKSLDAAESVSVAVEGDGVALTLVKPWRVKDRPLSEASLGSLPVCVAGSALSAWFKSPVVFEGEKDSDSGLVARFRVIRYRKGSG